MDAVGARRRALVSTRDLALFDGTRRFAGQRTRDVLRCPFWPPGAHPVVEGSAIASDYAVTSGSMAPPHFGAPRVDGEDRGWVGAFVEHGARERCRRLAGRRAWNFGLLREANRRIPPFSAAVKSGGT